MSNEFTAKTKEEAIAKGLSELGLTLEEAEVKVIEEPTKGIFGIGAKPARVAVKKKKTDASKTLDFLNGLLKIMNVTASPSIEEENEERVVVNLTTEDSHALIGYRGEILDSLQCLAGAVYNTDKEKYVRVVVDCENYRSKREKTLDSLAKKLAEKAKKTGRKICLEPMTPYERRIIHSALMDVEGVKTMSEGKEPSRFVAIIPDNYDPTKFPKKEFREKRFDKGDRFKGGKGNNGKFDRNRRSKFGGRDEKRAPKKAGFGGGVFLGNSLRESSADTKKSDEE